MRKILVFFIRVYQYVISPYMAPSCRFTPTCSNYSIEAIQRFGVIKGCLLAVRRISSCHPWHEAGHDPVPSSFSLFHKQHSETGSVIGKDTHG